MLERIRFRRVTMSAVLVASWLSACGGSSDQEDPGVPLEEVPQRLAVATCAAVENCLGSLLDLLFGGEDCVTLFSRAVEDGLPDLEQAIADGLVRYRGSRMDECLLELEVRTCEELNIRTSPVCMEALDGTVELGAECTNSSECKGALHCKNQDMCPGTCSELEPEGGACDRDEDCAD